MTFGVPLAGGQVSLLPMTSIAAYLIVGLVPAGWAAFAGALVHSAIRHVWAEQLEVPRHLNRTRVLSLAAANVTMQVACILAGGAAFQLAGGTVPLTEASPSQWPPLASLGLAYLAVNYLSASAFISMRGRKPLLLFIRSLPNLLLFEGLPIIFAPLTALIYIRLGLVQFVIFSCILILASLIARNLARASRRLERRVRELNSLQAVGRALSASLDPDVILAAIYAQVARLMPAHNFYVALYDRETDEVSFPLAIEDGNEVRWRSRQAGNGLTEYMLRTCRPLLIRNNVEGTLKELGIEQIGRSAVSWLGVPILMGTEALGVIAVQSYSAAELYDTSHLEVMVTIATQAAAAIQNARLYTRTDEALARRVQELGSILRTTREGILLLDHNWHVLAANRALADFLGMAQMDITGRYLKEPNPNGGSSLLERIGYTETGLKDDCQALTGGDDVSKRETITVPGPPERPVERTLTPVRGQDRTITGWLLVFRDLTEERELERLRDELMHMMVHDLRSPLTVLQGSLDMIESDIKTGETKNLLQLIELAHNGNQRMLRMVNELLDINKLESGKMPIQVRAVDATTLLQDAVSRITPLATAASIRIEVSIEPDTAQLTVDPKLMGRVLDNLLDNAIKFTPDGGLVRLWVQPDPASAGKAMLIGVSDNGPGIPEQEQRNLFKKFQQLSPTGRRRGTGLGLSFCKLTVEAHGGQIWVESKVEKGSTFVMRLPLVQ